MAAFDLIKFLLLKNTSHSVEVSSSPNTPKQIEAAFRRCSSKQVVLRNFANFIRKHQCWSLFLIKLQA